MMMLTMRIYDDDDDDDDWQMTMMMIMQEEEGGLKDVYDDDYARGGGRRRRRKDDVQSKTRTQPKVGWEKRKFQKLSGSLWGTTGGQRRALQKFDSSKKLSTITF